MDVGIECYDASGHKIFDNDFVTSRYLGSGSTGTTDGNITDSRIGGRKVWVAITNHETTGELHEWMAPTFSSAGNILSWTFRGSGRRVNCDFFYGAVYE